MPDGTLNPLGTILSPAGSPVLASASSASSNNNSNRTRAAATGCLMPPAKRQVQSFVWRAYQVWNSNLDLRKSPTLATAKRASSNFAMVSPL